MQSILKPLQKLAILGVMVLLCTGCTGAFLPNLDASPWKAVELPSESTMLDITFTEDGQHGWMVGKGETILETSDGGESWTDGTIESGDDVPHNFTSVSFYGEEGWVVGEPTIMFHTTDSGQSWDPIILSAKLPGTTQTITALGAGTAELTTDVGAIYRTEDGGQNWKAMVEEAVGFFRTISRSEDGQYVTVSARGNFYSTWEPGQMAWTPHNRNSSRRLQNMGFSKDGKLWLLARGGSLQLANSTESDDWGETINPEFASSWGFLDLAYRTNDELWVSGGSGTLLRSTDGGETWEKDKTAENLPNLYAIKFFGPDTGYILSQGNVLLKYVGTEGNAA
ncbi:MAG: photosynthesis system II assembly factor Ycf48 [Merismopedia sp. SIO2A8]|nr:photosynthesis system II assembly factor Ycf48 [Symploca sp. SIO2B6]NET47557.1 photosynthesis system II assembly factor Ycf48 [Merismopedia sp. SIO2A8]